MLSHHVADSNHSRSCSPNRQPLHQSRSRSPNREPLRQSRSRSRSPTPPTPPIDTHCINCRADHDSSTLHHRERHLICCGHGECNADSVDGQRFSAVVLDAIQAGARDATPAAWHWTGYHLAFRLIHGVGRAGERIQHDVCVLAAVREWVAAFNPQAIQEASEAQGAVQAQR